MPQDPNTIILESMLRELTTLRNYTQQTRQEEQRSARTAQNIAQVRVGDTQTGVASSVARQGPLQWAGTPKSTQEAVNATMQANTASKLLNQQATQSHKNASGPPDGTVDVAGRGADGGQGDALHPTTGEALTWSMLGEHGGPFGKLRTEQFVLNRNLGWAQRLAQTGQAKIADSAGGDPNILQQATSSSLGRLDQALQWGQDKKLGQVTAFALSKMPVALNAFNNMADAGRALGYGSADAQKGLWGHRFPFGSGPALGEGAALEKERLALEKGQGLGFSGGMTKKDATEAVGALAAQGFSNDPLSVHGALFNSVSGDNINLARHVMQPLMNMGLSAADAASFTPQLRGAAQSMASLRMELSNLPSTAQAARENVMTFAAGMREAGQIAVAQGGLAQQAQAQQMGSTQLTGASSTAQAAIAQNPLMATWITGSDSRLPSGLSAIPIGTVNQKQMQLIHSVMNSFQGAGFQNKYVPGTHVIQESGADFQAAAAASVLGMTQQEMTRLLKFEHDMGPAATRYRDLAQNAIGNSILNQGHGSGLYSLLMQGNPSGDWSTLSKANQQAAMTYWNKNINPNLSGMKLTHDQIYTIQHEKDVRKKADDLQQYLASTAKSDPANTITIGLTPEAARHFKTDKTKIHMGLDGPYGGARNSNASGPAGDGAAANQGAAMPMPAYGGGPSGTYTPMPSYSGNG